MSRKVEQIKNNPVAKNSRKFCKHAVHRNKKKDYKRNSKHKGKNNEH